MTSTARRQAIFVSRERSDVWISKQTGIPRSTLGFLRRGERTLPTAYSKVLRNVYQREAYNRMRAVGFSSSQAHRFSWYNPDKVTVNIQKQYANIQDTTLLRVSQKQIKLANQGISVDIMDIWEDIEKEVIEAYRQSDKTYEQWLNYQKRSV